MIDILKRRNEFIDMRSDTGTMPTDGMREAMAKAQVGDGGRVDLIFKGEDPSVTELEDRQDAKKRKCNNVANRQSCQSCRASCCCQQG